MKFCEFESVYNNIYNIGAKHCGLEEELKVNF